MIHVTMRVPLPVILTALIGTCGCDGDSGNKDATADTAADNAPDACASHPGTCNLDDRNPLAPWDCCPVGQTCCPLCHDETRCQFNYECMDRCPETLPCTGTPGTGALSCYYDPDDIPATAYCPVPEGAAPDGVVACTGTCETGVVCAFDEATFGDAALCCPASTSCAVSGFGLPFCE